MNTLEATKTARETLHTILGAPVETISACKKNDAGWAIEMEIVETKARISDNDLIAAYVVELDHEGDLTAYRRVNRYQRAHASQHAAQ